MVGIQREELEIYIWLPHHLLEHLSRKKKKKKACPHSFQQAFSAIFDDFFFFQQMNNRSLTRAVQTPPDQLEQEGELNVKTLIYK